MKPRNLPDLVSKSTRKLFFLKIRFLKIENSFHFDLKIDAKTFPCFHIYCFVLSFGEGPSHFFPSKYAAGTDVIIIAVKWHFKQQTLMSTFGLKVLRFLFKTRFYAPVSRKSGRSNKVRQLCSSTVEFCLNCLVLVFTNILFIKVLQVEKMVTTRVFQRYNSAILARFESVTVHS